MNSAQISPPIPGIIGPLTSVCERLPRAPDHCGCRHGVPDGVVCYECDTEREDDDGEEDTDMPTGLPS